MDQNEMMNQLANNPQLLVQLLQNMQQNGMLPNQQLQRQPMNWNVPTNPMAAMWWNNMNNMMNQANNQNVQNNQNQQFGVQQDENKQEEAILPVRIVKSPDDIKVDQVPMNDKISLFMQDDMSVIYGKRWTNNGSIENLRFILEIPQERNEIKNSNNQGINTEELMSAIVDVIDSKLDQFKKDYSFTRSQTKSRSSKKVGDVDGD